MYKYLVIYLVVCVASVLVSRLMITLGPRFGLMDLPSDRRVHFKATPRAGGIAIWVVFVSTAIILDVIGIFTPETGDGRLAGFLTASGILLIVGVFDDRGGIPALLKLGGQVLAAVVFWVLSDSNKDVLAGFPIPPWLDLIVWVAWIVLLINAYNLIDGLDGLCGGLAWISLGGILLAAQALDVAGDRIDQVVIMMAAIMGFLVYNRSPARLFLGDAGSMILGLFIATVATDLVGKRTVGAVVLLPIAVAGVPLFDVLLAVWRRSAKRFVKKLTGGSATGLFEADKEHLHHRLLSRGWSQRKVAEVLQVGAAALTILCFLPLLIGSSGWALVLPVLFIGGVFFLRHVTSVELIQSGNAIQLALRGPGTGRKRRVVYMALDVVLLCLAWGLAFFTSFKVSSDDEAWAFLLSYGVAQWLGAVGVLHLVGTYRIIWRRALLVEMATVFWTLAALGLGVGILVAVSSEGIQSAWIVITMALLGSLLSSIAVLVPRALGPYVSQLAIRSVHSDTGSKGNRVLVYGAGDLGVLFLDYLASRTRSMEMAELVGFVDDDQQACGRVLRGFRILGAGADLTRVVQERGIDEVVVAIDGLSPEFISDLQERIQSACPKVRVRRWSCGFEESGVDSKEEDLEVARET